MFNLFYLLTSFPHILGFVLISLSHSHNTKIQIFMNFVYSFVEENGTFVD
jgi:hypothetical protein